MLKVLLVEDEDLIRRGLRFQMDWTAAGCVVVDEARSGEEGLEKIRALRPDVVITDVRMQDMDGLEMLERGLELCAFDAIVVSGYSEFDYAQQAIRLGVVEYLLKPVDFNDLQRCIQKIMARRQRDSQGLRPPRRSASTRGPSPTATPPRCCATSWSTTPSASPLPT